MTLDRSVPPSPGPPPILEEIRPARARLADGMQVTWLDRPRLPEVSLRLVVPAAGAEGPDQAGIAALAGRLLPEGAAGLGSRDVAAWLDGLGAHLHVSVNHDATVLRLHVLSEFLEEGLDVLRALALEPDFPSAEVERCRAERVDAIRRLRDDPTEVSADLMAELLYGDHPYGRLARGRAESVAELERPDLVDFHRERYAPAGATLVAVGDLGGDRFRTAVEERFGRTAGHTPRSEPPPNAVASHTTGLVLVDRPGSRQSVIRIAGIGSSRGAAEEPTARVGNAILGGLFNSRLNMNLREDKGWTYGARSILELRRSAGPITLRAAVDTAFTADAVREMVAEVRAMRETEPAADEMVLAAAALTRSLPLRFETASQLAGRLVEQVLYGLADDYWSGFADAIRAVSDHEVREWAERFLDPADLVMLVVGDAAVVKPGLAEMGPVELRSPP